MIDFHRLGWVCDRDTTMKPVHTLREKGTKADMVYFQKAHLYTQRVLIGISKVHIKSNHFYCHITTAQVPWWMKILRACSRQCRKTKQQFTYGQYIFTDCTEDNVQNTHTYTQYTVYYKDILRYQCTNTHYTPYLHVCIMSTSMHSNMWRWRCSRL